MENLLIAGCFMTTQTEDGQAGMPVLPAMISWVTRLDCDKRAATGGRHVVVRDQFAFHSCAVSCRVNYSRNQMDGFIGGGGPSTFDVYSEVTVQGAWSRPLRFIT